MEVTGGEHAWRAVSDPAGANGWMANEYLAAVGGRFQVANTAGAGANLRTQPDPSAEAVRLVAEGTELTGDQNAWRQVTDPAGTRGWIAQDLLVAEANATPPRTPATA